jgi:hypothetical protein
VEEVDVSAATRDGGGCNWIMPDFTLQNLQLNILTGINSLEFLVLHSRRIWLQGTVILLELEKGGLPKCMIKRKKSFSKGHRDSELNFGGRVSSGVSELDDEIGTSD